MTHPNDALVRELRAFLQYVRDEDFLPEHGNLVARAIAALEPGPHSSSNPQADAAHHAQGGGTGVGPESLPPVDPPPTAEDMAAKWLHGLFVQIEHGDEEHRRWLSSKLNDTVPSLAALIAASRRQWQPEWQDISTAPKDGSSFIACSGNWMTVGHWHRAMQKWCCTSPSYELYPHDEQPTRWMPLPTPPASIAREQGL